jgi:carboxypeptidase family protein/TonB-dependent receptor-like protein
MKRITYVLLIGMVLLSVGSGNAFAQANASASLQGTITDQSDASVKGAKVAITSNDQGWTRSADTSDTGFYRFELLPAGMYSIKVNASGFATAEAKEVELQVGATTTQNFTLKPGSMSEIVEVTSAPPLVDQLKMDVSTNITPQQIQELPLIGRDIADLAYLSPGVKSADSYDPTKNRYSILSVNGQGGRNVNVTVNGVDNKDNTVGGPVMQLPAEAVQEFQISTQRFSAVNGRSEGAAINVITKSGTNSYHGSAFGFFREQALNAAQKLANPGLNNCPSGGALPFCHVTPPYERQWFGGSVGGPVKKDKLFAFFAMEREREHTALAEDPTALAELNLVTSLGAQPSATVPTPFFENRINGRMDWTINNKHTAYVSVSTQANNSLNDQSNGTYDLTEGNFTKNHLQVANLTLNSAFTSTLLNQFTAGWQYWNNLIDSTTRAPLVTFPNAQFGTNTNVPQESIQRKWQFKDDLSKTIGKHTLQTGFDYIWTPFMGGFFEFNPTLEIDFTDNPSVILGNDPLCGTKNHPQCYPNQFATGGAVNAMTIAVGDPHFIIKDAKQLGLYFQDDWKMTRRLTVNLGLRWDKDYDFVGGSDIANSRTFQELQAAAPFSPLAASLVAKKASDYNKNFSPRVGFAYDLTGHGTQVLRGGFGIYYGNTFQNIPLFMEQQSNATIFQTAFSISGSDLVPGVASCGFPAVSPCTLNAWRYGKDPLPTIPPPSASLATGATGRLMDPNYRNPVTEEWNGGYTWSITSKSVIEAEYVHVLSLHENKTINLDAKIPINPANITTRSVTEDAAGKPVCSASSCGFYHPLDAAFTAAGVPVLGSLRNDASIGRSRYDGMNISYRQRNFHHVDLIANYTLAKAQGYDQDGGSYRYYPRDPQNPFSPNEFGPSFNDERQHVTIAGTVNLPWRMEFSPILQAGSARPYNPISSSNMLNLSGGSSTGALIVTNSTPNDLLSATKLTPLVDSVSMKPSLGLAEAVCYYSNNCHVAPYDSVRGDPYFDMDVRLAKNIKLGEGRNLQLAWQGFNLFNHANYGNNFDTVVQSKTFAKAIGFINPTSATLPRAFTAEFGARFTF